MWIKYVIISFLLGYYKYLSPYQLTSCISNIAILRSDMFVCWWSVNMFVDVTNRGSLVQCCHLILWSRFGISLQVSQIQHHCKPSQAGDLQFWSFFSALTHLIRDRISPEKNGRDILTIKLDLHWIIDILTTNCALISMYVMKQLFWNCKIEYCWSSHLCWLRMV